MMNEFKKSEAELQQSFEMNANGETGGYTGDGDSMIDFGTANSFANETSSKRMFGYKIANSGSDDVTIALCPAHYTEASEIKDASGAAVDAILKEGQQIITAGVKEITCAGDPKSIAEFIAFFKKHPTRIHMLRMSATDAETLNQPIYYREVSPFAGASEFSRFTPGDDVKSSDQKNLVNVDLQSEDFQFSQDRVVIITIPAGKTVDMKWFTGAISNECKALSRKAKFGRLNA